MLLEYREPQFRAAAFRRAAVCGHRRVQADGAYQQSGCCMLVPVRASPKHAYPLAMPRNRSSAILRQLLRQRRFAFA
jgi:hypothetical protein